jgi:hypothetical protein
MPSSATMNAATINEESNHEQSQVSPLWQSVGQVWSYLLHPLFLPLIISGLILYRHPLVSLLANDGEKIRLMVMTGINTILFPALIVFLLWRLKFVQNMYMTTQRERIIPLSVSVIFYFWAWYVSRNLDFAPQALQQWLLGVFLASCAANFTNIFFKLSLHTLGWGGVIGFFLARSFTDQYWPAGWIIPALLLAGLAGTARLLKSAHQPAEVYAGYLAGIICQVAAAWIAL